MPFIGINIDSTADLGENKNNSKLKFQAEKTEVLDGNGLKITGIKQAQKMNGIV